MCVRSLKEYMYAQNKIKFGMILSNDMYLVTHTPNSVAFYRLYQGKSSLISW